MIRKASSALCLKFNNQNSSDTSSPIISSPAQVQTLKNIQFTPYYRTNSFFSKNPAVSPTMNEGNTLKWKIQPGFSFSVGDTLFSIETDKAVIDYEATQKGFLAKITVKDN